jgi:hypothetical protein
MSAVDRDGNKERFINIDKFIEIEINKANESGRVCFVQFAREPGIFSIIVGIRIEESQTA